MFSAPPDNAVLSLSACRRRRSQHVMHFPQDRATFALVISFIVHIEWAIYSTGRITECRSAIQSSVDRLYSASGWLYGLVGRTVWAGVLKLGTENQSHSTATYSTLGDVKRAWQRAADLELAVCSNPVYYVAIIVCRGQEPIIAARVDTPPKLCCSECVGTSTPGRHSRYY